MVLPEAHRSKFWLGVQGARRSSGKSSSSRGRGKGQGRGGKTTAGARKVSEDTDEVEKEDHMPEHMKTTFPVVITTYEMLMKDRAYLAAYRWGFIVVDEGHRLKNMDCKLMQEIKQITADGRMVLTGTPLHVSITDFTARS